MNHRSGYDGAAARTDADDDDGFSSVELALDFDGGLVSSPGGRGSPALTDSLPSSPGELLMYSSSGSSTPALPGAASRTRSPDRRSPTRLVMERQEIISAPPTGIGQRTNYSNKSQSQSLPTSPFFAQSEIEQHGLKAREITQQLFRSLNETKDRLGRQNDTIKNPGPAVDNILEHKVTVIQGKEPYKRRLFQDESPGSILRGPTSPKKQGPVMFNTNVSPESTVSTQSDWTVGSFKTLPHDSSRSLLFNSENESLSAFDDYSRRCNFYEAPVADDEFIPGLDQLTAMTSGSSTRHGHNDQARPSSQASTALSPGAKAALETLQDEPTPTLRPEQYATVTSNDILEMESIRGHLHKMLKSNKERTSSDSRPYRTIGEKAPTMPPPNQDQFSSWSQPTCAMPLNNWASLAAHEGTSRSGWVKRSSRSAVSPDVCRLEADAGMWNEPGQSEAGAWCRSNVVGDSTSYSDLDLDEAMALASRITGRPREQQISVPALRGAEPIHYEIRVLKDLLEREKFRRQHCERIIEALQRRLTDSQEQLTMSVCTERKKDIMIDQLDQTLCRVVDGWRQREAEKQILIEQLKTQSNYLEEQIAEKTQILSQFECDLQNACQDLASEQRKVTELEQFKEEEHEREHERLSQLMEKQQKRLNESEREKEQFSEQLEEMKKERANLHEVLLEERSGWQETTEDLKLKINDLEMDLHQCLTTEKQRADDAENLLEGTKDVLSSVQKELQKYQNELDVVTRERNTLRVEMGLLEARMESSKRKLESELTTEFDKTLSKKLAEANDGLARTEKELRDNHNKQIKDMSEKHQRSLDDTVSTLKDEFEKREKAYKEENGTLKESLENATREIRELKAAKQKVEAQRDRLYPVEKWHTIRKEDLLKNLHSLMESHCSQAEDILDNTSHQHNAMRLVYDELDNSSIPQRGLRSRTNSPAVPFRASNQNVGRSSPAKKMMPNSNDARFSHVERVSDEHSWSVMRDSNQMPSSNSHHRSYQHQINESYDVPRQHNSLANQRQLEIEASFNLQSAPSTYLPTSTNRVHEMDFDDGVSDVLSNDENEIYYPINAPSRNYVTPAQTPTNQVRGHHLMMRTEDVRTPRVVGAPVRAPLLRTPLTLAPPVACSTEIRETKYTVQQPTPGSLLSSGYHSTMVDKTRYSLNNNANVFVPLQQCDDETSINLETTSEVSADDDQDGHYQTHKPISSSSGSRPRNERQKESRNASDSKHRKQSSRGMVDMSRRTDESFQSLPPGRSCQDMSERDDKNIERKTELENFVQKLLNNSADRSKENLPPYSPPQRMENVDKREKNGTRPTSTGVLTPSQVAQLQRLLDSYQQSTNGLNETNQARIEDLLTYLNDAEVGGRYETGDDEQPIDPSQPSDSRLVSVSHAPNYTNSTNAARQKLYERRPNSTTPTGVNNKSNSGAAKTSAVRTGTKPDRRVAPPRSGTPVWR